MSSCDMVLEMYSYSKGTLSPFLSVQWRGRETDHSLRAGGLVPPQNLIRNCYLPTSLNPLEIF